MMNILNKLAIAIAPLTLLATIPPVHAATEPDGGPEPKDYSKLYEEYTPLKPKKDPETGFIVAGKNTSELIKGLTEISGIPVAELEESMRPGGLSLAGFLGKDERLLEVLTADNAWVLEAGLTHQELARHLNVLVSIAIMKRRREDSEVFVYRGVRFTTSKREWLGYQESPFRDGTKTSRDIVLKNVDNGKILKFSPLVPMMVERYGFYEGHGTSYRVDPRDILKVLTFLEVKNGAEQVDAADHSPAIMLKLNMSMVAGLCWLAGASSALAAQSPEEIVAGFDKRVEAMFRAESGKPLVRAEKQKPLDPGRGNYVRAYSYSMVGFAARCLYLNEMLDEANAALAENAQHYLDNPKDVNDRDSFHWHADIVMRLVEMYGSKGIKHPGRITKETEALVLKPIWEYVKQVSWLGKAEHEKSKTWHIYLSENHHAMSFTVCWHFSKIAKDRPEYRDLKYDDGATAAEHYRAWNEYFVVYCRERARKSPCIEMMSDNYNATLIKGFYNFYDFGDPQVRRSAGLLLDLYFAYWAQEQIDGVQGGGRSRIYFYKGLSQDRNHGNAPLAWFYFGIGKQPAVYGHDMDAALSDYRPPAVVADIALDVSGRGRFEVRQRPQGLGVTGRPLKTAVTTVPSKMRTDGGGILRYSFCDPAFIMGTPMTTARPLEDWAAISAQNRWQGAIFAGGHDTRIVPIVRPKDNRRALNAQWSVQSKGSLITQKLKHHRGGAEMIIWMSNDGLSVPVEEDGIIFVEAENAYAGIKVVQGGFKWRQTPFIANAGENHKRSTPEGKTMILNEEYAPVILEVMAKSDVSSFDAFKVKMKKAQSKMNNTLLEYTTIYGEQITLDTSFEKTPTINGKPVDYAPKKVFESPFLNADWNSGIVTITKGDRKKVLNFESGNSAQRK